MNTAQSDQLKPMLFSLFILAGICALLIGTVHHCSENKILKNRQAAILKLVKAVMPLHYDNDLLTDRLEILDPDYFGRNKPVMVYRARLGGQGIGAVFMPVNANGYNDLIELSIGVSYEGDITAVRVVKHNETEGLGDGIDQRNSDWITGFTHRSLANTVAGGWAVKKDGGEFDALSGATISSRGVINAVKNTLDYYDLNRQKLYE